MMDLGLSGRRAAVAAASAGLGLAVAEALRAQDVDVAICARTEPRLVAAAERIGAIPIVEDVSTAAGGRRFVDQAIETLGGLDILVPNAGGPPLTGAREADVEAYRAAIEANLLSVVAMCNRAIPNMVARGWGRVVAITSVSVRQPIDGLVLSTTARAGTTGYLKSLAIEVASLGVTVNSLQPGFHVTERSAAATDEMLAAVPAGRMGDRADFGAIAAFLCSEQANYVTGAAVPVAGGYDRGLQ